MRLTVRLFARLRDVAGCAECACDVESGASAADVWRALTSRYPGLEPYGSSVSCALNTDFAKMTAIVHDGDEVAFLPPVSGGVEPGRRGGVEAAAKRR
jgi:molybdopterin converting factor subunit 1